MSTHTARTARLATRAWEDQRDLARWLYGPMGSRYVQAFMHSNPLLRRIVQPSDLLDTGRTMDAVAVERLAKGLLRGRTIYVSASMSSLAEQSREDFGKVPLTLDQIPAPQGWMWLEQPVMLLDLWGWEYRVRAVQWQVLDREVVLALWSDMSVEDDFTSGRDRRMNSWSHEATDAASPEKFRELFDAGYSPMDFGVLKLGIPALQVQDRDPEEVRAYYLERMADLKVSNGLEPEFVAAQRAAVAELDDDALMVRYRATNAIHATVQVLWALCGQSVVKRTAPDRAARKRVGRSLKRFMSKADIERYLAEVEADVHVMTLRTEYAPDGPRPEEDAPDAGPGWTHRWVVRPFWRWQWYGGKDRERQSCEHCGRQGGVHRRILIPPHVKGPEHLPLIEKNVVDALVR